MKQSKLSMLVFAIYMAILGMALVFFPDALVAVFKLGQPDGLWIRVSGMLLGILAFYYLMAVR